MRRTMITGATSGLGLALIARLQQTGKLIGVGRDPRALDSLSKISGVDEAIACGLADSSALALFLEGRSVDVLVNNARILPSRGGAF